MATTEEIQEFKNRWLFWPIAQSARMRMEILNLSGELKKLMDDFYFSKATQSTWPRKDQQFFQKFFDYKMSKEEKAIIDHPLGKELMDIWTENIEGVKKGFGADAQRCIEFFKFLYKHLEIMHNPENSEISENFQNLGFSLKILRPNNQAHIYLSFSFVMRPLKKFIAEYLRMSVITGDYEILFRRFPPWHFMLAINVAPGQRTLWDHRGLDFPPIIYKLDLKYTLALELKNIQTRSNDRSISCPIVSDLELEKHKEAELKKFDEDLKSIFPHKGYIFGAQFDEEGRAYLDKGPKKNGKSGDGEDREKEIITMYGARRARYLGIEAQANLIKAIPTPGTDSGLIIKFNLLHPIAVLLEGINREKNITLDEIPYLWKSLDIIKGELFKPKAKRRDFGEIIDGVFSNPNPMGVAAETKSILNEIEKLRGEDPTDEKAWKYFIDRMVEGRGGMGQPILQAICTFLLLDGFDVVFSLWPLITGNDISVDQSTGEVEETLRFEKKTLLPLLDILKKELESLLTNVFTKYIDISAATMHIRSEPILAEMIIAHCLNVKSDRGRFVIDLRKHLMKHYETHQNFLREYLEDKLNESPALNSIYNLDFSIDELVERDSAGIVSLIDQSRERLYSPGESSRLLCFINPFSVDVQIGKFLYQGESLKSEQEYLAKVLKHQHELSELKMQQEYEQKKIETEKEGVRKLSMSQLELLALEEESKRSQVEAKKRIDRIESEEISHEVATEIKESLKKGKLKEFAALSLLQAYHEGGIEAIENILESSPNLLMALQPELYEKKVTRELKQQLVSIIEKDTSQINPVTLSMLFKEELEGVIDPEIYGEIDAILAEAVKNFRLGQPPFSDFSGDQSEN
ncbi:hypothetical protein QUF76_01935 [Desulfobacterales bacterium HSG16]|nr:hypothetical protein [Desulfobacterales bacterium HSG16]